MPENTQKDIGSKKLAIIQTIVGFLAFLATATIAITGVYKLYHPTETIIRIDTNLPNSEMVSRPDLSSNIEGTLIKFQQQQLDKSVDKSVGIEQGLSKVEHTDRVKETLPLMQKINTKLFSHLRDKLNKFIAR